MRHLQAVGHIERGDLVYMLDDGTVCTASYARNVVAIAVALFGWLP